MGWFLGSGDDNAQLDETAEYLKKNRRAGRCKYVQNSSTIYSLHVDDLKKNWLEKYNFDIENLKQHTNFV